MTRVPIFGQQIMKRSLTVLVVLWFVALAAGASCAQCTLTYVPHAYPAFSATPKMGYNFGAAYNKTNLQIPEPIPLGIALEDQDTYLLHCNTRCRPHTFAIAAPRVNWSCGAVGGLAGAFVDADGALVVGLNDAPYVLYLPPLDLAPGAQRTTTVSASIVDTVQDCHSSVVGFDDTLGSIGTVTFTITTSRNLSDLLYQVSVTESHQFPSIAEPACAENDADPCQYVPWPPAHLPGTAPTARFVAWSPAPRFLWTPYSGSLS